MREALTRDLGVATDGVFAFAGTRCDRIVSHVLSALTVPTDPALAGQVRRQV